MHVWFWSDVEKDKGPSDEVLTQNEIVQNENVTVVSRDDEQTDIRDAEILVNKVLSSLGEISSGQQISERSGQTFIVIVSEETGQQVVYLP